MRCPVPDRERPCNDLPHTDLSGPSAIFRDMPFLRTAAISMTLALTAACGDDPTGPVSPLFTRYVALGNSITAGFQSGGINDATQRASFAALIARQAHARYAYASLGDGCPPPIANLLDAVATGTTDPTCSVAGIPGRKLLNNVAVPGADSFDPIAADPSIDVLASLILDGQNQVDKALEVPPTFVSIWIGNNDVLAAAITAQLGAGNGPTPHATFAANYAQMVNRLRAGGVEAGMLIGVSDVTRIPLLVPASALSDPALRFGLNIATGRTVTVSTDCAASSASISLAIIPEIASGAHPPTIACTATPGSAIGDRFVLDAVERAAIVEAVAGYNTYISAKADSVGFAYFDPNPMFMAARARGEIPAIPDITNLDAPFGPLFSLDGVHPSNRGHVVIANELMGRIAGEYSVRLRPIN